MYTKTEITRKKGSIPIRNEQKNPFAFISQALKLVSKSNFVFWHI